MSSILTSGTLMSSWGFPEIDNELLGVGLENPQLSDLQRLLCPIFGYALYEVKKKKKKRKHKDQAASNSGPKSNTGNSKGKGLQVKQSDGKFKKIGNSKQGNFKSVPQCAICGRAHARVCRKEKGLYYKCGQPGHFIKDCPFSGGQVSAIQATSAPKMIEEPSLPPPPPTARVYAVTQPEAEKSSTLVRGMISIKDELLSVLFDSGATHSFIADYVADAFCLPLTIMKTPMRIVTVVGSVFNEKYICEDVKFKYEGKEYSADFIVLHLAS
ncbi:uncharacterized protein LOC133303097, partial [Gastrolobium bilobum]|uniref:uncharacterized protein LOC133303097 n=1 Tax=Gastrolobium bilobum TaxID=150636 RepID=UPI002AAF80C0